MITTLLVDGPAPFDVSLSRPSVTSCTALFLAGRGGNPLRYRSFLERLSESGCSVIAPHFEMLPSPIPSAEDLLSRGRRVDVALARHQPAGVPLVGIGHSIGATMLLALAGGQAWTRAGERVALPSTCHFVRLALLAPATDFFRPPDALDELRSSVIVWVGSEDRITPPTQADFLARALTPRISIDVRVLKGAGHFTFMDDLPPGIDDPYPNREIFIDRIADEACRFLLSDEGG